MFKLFEDGFERLVEFLIKGHAGVGTEFKLHVGDRVIVARIEAIQPVPEEKVEVEPEAADE